MKPKFSVGQILMMESFVPPDLYKGEPVAVIDVKPDAHSVRYQVKRICLDKTGWVDEEALTLPMGGS